MLRFNMIYANSFKLNRKYTSYQADLQNHTAPAKNLYERVSLHL